MHALRIDAAPHAAEVGDHFLAAHAAELRDVAGQVADEALDLDGVAAAIEAENVGRPGGGTDHAHYAADGRRLARAVRAEVPENLLGLNLQVEVEQAPPGPVVLGQPVGTDRRDRHRRSIFHAPLKLGA